jgi:acetate kinase
MTESLILTINSGSSSLKSSLYRMDEEEQLLVVGQLEGITRERGRFRMKDAAGTVLVDQELNLPDHATALRTLLGWLKEYPTGGTFAAVGHRVVHGGSRFRVPHLITPELLAEVRNLIPFAPLHLPSEVAAIESLTQLLPGLPQIACFDTSFHRTLQDVARILPLPHRYAEQGIHRYGFHGLSYEYILEEMTRLDPVAAQGCLVICHLGSGASMAAVRGGQCVDTTMGFTATGGLVMASRTGDLDPGVLLYLLAVQKVTVPDLIRLLNLESGLLGLSGISADVRDLLATEASRPTAKLALDIFCYQARKFIGALAAGLCGLETLVFTAGIGENSAVIRQRICDGLNFLGITLDAERNQTAAPVVSSASSRVTVRVIPTNEELMIARHTLRLMV